MKINPVGDTEGIPEFIFLRFIRSIRCFIYFSM